MNQKKELTWSQRIWWALGQSSGRQWVTALVSSYILVFLTDTFGVPAGAAGVIMTCAAVWDAINDPILGSIADRTKTRWGTYRPYLLFVPVPLSVVAVLLFAAPDLSTSGKIVYAAVLYICYGMLVTCIEIPYNALLPTMSKNDMEKNDTIALSTFIASIVILVVTSFTASWTEILGGGNVAKGYVIMVLIGAIMMIITSWMAFLKCKEKYVNEEKNEEPIRVGLVKLFKVKQIYPMLAFWCVGCILFQIIMTSTVYYCMYFLMDPSTISVSFLAFNIGGMIGVLVVMPIVLRKVKGSIQKAVTYTQLVVVVLYVALFFLKGKSMPAMLVLLFIAAIFTTMTNAFRPMTVVGMTEYIRLEKGEQLNGTLAAIGGFAYKCGTALSAAILSFVLAATGYIPNAIGEEPASVLFGINAVHWLVPAAATVIYIICIQFYPEKRLRELQAAEEAASQEE